MRVKLLRLPALFLLLLNSSSLVQADGKTGRMPVGTSIAAPAQCEHPRLQMRRNYIVRAVQRVKGAVVNIHSERSIRTARSDLFSLPASQNRVNGMGTGIIIDPRGYIVTNQHVVEDVSSIRVRLSDGTTTAATVVARNPEVDLALLKISVNRALPTMPLGTAQDLMEGEDVIAIGNAFGYPHTVSRGIVSAIKRDVDLNKTISYRSLIQTDASINPGNSGGPLLNVHGELVGINVAIRAGAQGIGFAIPVDTMVKAVSEMLRNRRLHVAAEGMRVRDQVVPTPDGAVRRVVVESVAPDGPAAAAGLRRGDEIASIAGIPIQCSYDVDRALLGRRPQVRVPVVIRRDGKQTNAVVTLKAGVRSPADGTEVVWTKLGLQFTPTSRAAVAQINPQLNGGLQVTRIDTDGAAYRAGIRRGDILVGLHEWETLSVENVVFVLQHPDLAHFNPLPFYIIRDSQVRRGWLEHVE